MEEVLGYLGELRDLLGQLRRRADAPQSFQQEFASLAPLLSGALGTARSLAAFSKGEVEREAVLVSELVQALRLPGLQLDLGPGAEALAGDAALLRLALRVLVDEVRAHGGPQALLRLETRSEAGRLRLSVAGAPPTPDPGHLGLVQRIAELHGGKLQLDNDLEGAPRFSLYLTPA
jgi:signal transduction histidine kinase